MARRDSTPRTARPHRSATRSAARHGGIATRVRSLGPPVLASAVIGAAVRLAHLADLADAPSFALPLVDAEVYVDAARSLALGHGFTEAFFYQPFLYPFLLGLVFAVAGPSLVLARVLQIVVGAATAALATSIADRAFGRTAAWVAGIGAALCGPLVFHDLELLATGLAALWSMVLVILFQRLEDRPTRLLAAGTGVVCGLAIATRPVFLPVVAALAVALLLGRRRPPWRLVVTAGAGAAAVLAALAVVTAVETGRASFLPASGGLNLYLGNNPDRCATLTVRPGEAWHELVTTPRRLDAGGGLWQDDDWFAREARRWAVGHPADAVAGWGAKLVEFVSSREIPRNLDPYLMRRWSRVLAATMWKVGDFGFPAGVILPLAAIGLVAAWRRAPRPLLVAAAVYPAAVALVFVSSRYRAPWLPLALILAGAGVDALVRWTRSRDVGRLAIAAAVAVAVVVVAVVPGPFCTEGDLEAEYWFLVGAAQHRTGDDVAAVASLERAVTMDGDRFESRLLLGAVLASRGDVRAAEMHLRRAVELRPDRADTWRELGEARLRAGETVGAIDALERAALADPDDFTVRLNLGSALARLGAYERARPHLEAAVRLNPGDPRAAAALEELLRRLGPGSSGPG